MVPKTCIADCTNSYCPFIQDPENNRRYVCLKCGLDRSLDKEEDKDDRSSVIPLMLMGVIMILVLL